MSALTSADDQTPLAKTACKLLMSADVSWPISYSAAVVPLSQKKRPN